MGKRRLNYGWKWDLNPELEMFHYFGLCLCFLTTGLGQWFLRYPYQDYYLGACDTQNLLSPWHVPLGIVLSVKIHSTLTAISLMEAYYLHPHFYR